MLLCAVRTVLLVRSCDDLGRRLTGVAVVAVVNRSSQVLSIAHRRRLRCFAGRWRSTTAVLCLVKLVLGALSDLGGDRAYQLTLQTPAGDFPPHTNDTHKHTDGRAESARAKIRTHRLYGVSVPAALCLSPCRRVPRLSPCRVLCSEEKSSVGAPARRSISSDRL